MSPQTRATLSPPPLDRNITAVTSEVASSSQYPRMSPNDIYRGPAPEHRQWPRNCHKFWIYGSPSSSSSQDGRSSTSSGGNSTASEGPEVKRAQTVSPYGSFFAEEMEFDTPTESRSSYPGDRQENATVFTDKSRAFHPTQESPSTRGWTGSQAQVAPVFFVPGYPTHNDSIPLGAIPAQDRNVRGPMRVPLLQSYLAENSRLSRPPDSWRAEFLDRTYSPHWQNTQRDSPSPQAATTLPPGRPHTGQNGRQTRGMAHGKRRK